METTMNVSKSQSDGEELLSFAPEAETVHEPAKATRPLPPWRILVIDDDPEVHQVTRFALNRVELLGRQLELIHGHSAAEAADILRHQQEIAVILLDVVMESDDAGLKLVDYIRQVMKLPLPRIILRTGQPGYAPELDVMARYDINDYRTKSELTQNRMIATLTAALRSYDQLRTIMLGRAGMQSIIEASADLIKRSNFQSLLERLPNHMQTLGNGVSEWMIALVQNWRQGGIGKTYRGGGQRQIP
jgi:CheY-like chemotaxis protein